jgi:hypothetical protein
MACTVLHTSSALSLLILILKLYKDRHWWLTPAILSTWEAEIRRIKV